MSVVASPRVTEYGNIRCCCRVDSNPNASNGNYAHFTDCRSPRPPPFIRSGVNIYSTFDILIAHYTTPQQALPPCTRMHELTLLHACEITFAIVGCGLLVRKRDLPDTSHVSDSIQFAHLHRALLCNNIAKHINDATIHLCHTLCPLPALLLCQRTLSLSGVHEMFIGPSPFLRIFHIFLFVFIFLTAFGRTRSQSMWRVQCFRRTRLEGGCGKGQKRSPCNYKNVRFDIMWMTRKQLTAMRCAMLVFCRS